MRLYYQIVHRKRLIGLSKAPVPRASGGALDFVEKNISVAFLLDPVNFLNLREDERRTIVEENRRLFREARLRWVVVHKTDTRMAGNYWVGVNLVRLAVNPDLLGAFDRALRLHGGIKVRDTEDLAAYRF